MGRPKENVLQNSTIKEKSSAKKDADKTTIRPVKFTSNRVLDAVSSSDKIVEICGYIDVAERAKTVGKDGKFTIIKFVLNNNCGKRVQCVAWDQHVDRVKEMVQINKIVRLNGAVAKKIDNPVWNIGTVPYELSIQDHTEIIDKGVYIAAEDSSSRAEPVTWDDVGDMEGRFIEIQGHLKMLFSQTKHKTGDAMYTIGAITDGELKLAIRVTDAIDLPIDLRKGCIITVVGVLIYDGEIPYVKVAKGSYIKKIEGTPMDEDDMMEAAGMPHKKVKVNKLPELAVTDKAGGAL